MSKPAAAATWDEFVQELGHNIAEVREQRQLSQEAVSARTGLSRQTYQRIERGVPRSSNSANPTLVTLLAITCALGVEIGEIIPEIDEEMIFHKAASAGKTRLRALPKKPVARRGGFPQVSRPITATEGDLEQERMRPDNTLSRFANPQDLAARRRTPQAGRAQQSNNRIQQPKRRESGPWHEKFGVRFQE